jgi:hypothetical protein
MLGAFIATTRMECVMSETTSEKVQDTAALKAERHPNISANFVKQWRFQNFASVQEAL